MTITDEDVMYATQMAYREAANQGDTGIAAVLWVAKNNAIKKNISIFEEVAVTPFRYSSMNCPVSVANYVQKGKLKALQEIVDALGNYPHPKNSVEWNAWNRIKDIVKGVLSGATPDITNGATLYYSTAMLASCPFDASKIEFTTQIGVQRFYREV